MDHIILDACLAGNFKGIKKRLNEGVNIDTRDECGWTILYHSCVDDDYKVVKFLLEENADPNIQNDNERTALHHCCINGKYNLCKLLLENKANATIRDCDKDTPLHCFLLNLQICNYKDRIELLEILLNSSNINQQNKKGYTPLHTAFRMSDPRTIEYLILNGADVNIQDKKGRYAIDHNNDMREVFEESLEKLAVKHSKRPKASD